jgi:hypothetical protein
VADAPMRRFSSRSALLSIRLNWTFSLRRLSPDEASVWPSRLSCVRCAGAFSVASGLGLAGSSGFGGVVCASVEMPGAAPNQKMLLRKMQAGVRKVRFVIFLSAIFLSA